MLGGGRSSALSRRMSLNRSLGTAPQLPAILTDFLFPMGNETRLRAEHHCLKSSGIGSLFRPTNLAMSAELGCHI